MIGKYFGYKVGFTPGEKGYMADPDTGKKLDSEDDYWLAIYDDWELSKGGNPPKLLRGIMEIYDDFPDLYIGLTDLIMDEEVEIRLAFDKKSKHLIPVKERNLVRGVIKFYNSLIASKKEPATV